MFKIRKIEILYQFITLFEPRLLHVIRQAVAKGVVSGCIPRNVMFSFAVFLRRVCKYQRGNQNPYIEEEQTTQWLKKKDKRINNDLQNIYLNERLRNTNPTKN